MQKVQPRTKADAEVRVRDLEVEVRKLMLERDILKKAAAYFAQAHGIRGKSARK